MNTEELSNRLTQILTGITSGEPNPNIIQGFVQNFIEDFKPDYYYEILVTDVEGYTPTFIEYYTWYKTFQRLQHIPWTRILRILTL